MSKLEMYVLIVKVTTLGKYLSEAVHLARYLFLFYI